MNLIASTSLKALFRPAKVSFQNSFQKVMGHRNMRLMSRPNRNQEISEFNAKSKEEKEEPSELVGMYKERQDDINLSENSDQVERNQSVEEKLTYS
jgi:hypothetical protein